MIPEDLWIIWSMFIWYVLGRLKQRPDVCFPMTPAALGTPASTTM